MELGEEKDNRLGTGFRTNLREMLNDNLTGGIYVGDAVGYQAKQ